jgi:cytochrome c oxidase subunit 2
MSSDLSGGHMLRAAGDAALAIEQVSWVLIVGATVIFGGVMLLLAWALRRRGTPVRPLLWLAGGGVALPTVVLGALFAWSLPLSPVYKPVPPPGALVVAVTGRLWWWEVRYTGLNGADVITANEIRIPTGRPVYLALSSSRRDPQLLGAAACRQDGHGAGAHQLAGAQATPPAPVPRPVRGVLRRAACAHGDACRCARACGLRCLAGGAGATCPLRRSHRLQCAGCAAFTAQRCTPATAVRGVSEEGRLGPDLTHVGSRLHLGAGTLRNDAAAMQRWIAHVQQ